jgi:putative peptidoglycan lipid II flippase
MNTITVFWLKLGHEWLALSTSVSAFVNFSLLFWAMRKIAGGLDTRGLAVNFGKLLISVVCMGAVCWISNATLLDHFTEKALILRVLYLGVTIGGAAAVYFGMNALLKNEEVAEFGAILRRKLGRK